MFSFTQKMVILFQNSGFGEIQFSQKSLTNRKKATPYPSTTRPLATNPNDILLLLQAPALLQVPEKKAKILEKGARGDRGSPE